METLYGRENCYRTETPATPLSASAQLKTLNQRLDEILIENLVATAHEQWICRNLCKHLRTQGAKALAARDEIHSEIERQLDLCADDLPDHGRCLFEICPDHLYVYGIPLPSDWQQYWLNAVEAARVELFAQSATTIEEKQDGCSTGIPLVTPQGSCADISRLSASCKS